MADDQAGSASAAAADAVLTVRDLECRRGDHVLFAPISLVVAAGTIVWVRGANGQGKTTLLRTIAGLSAPSAGEIAWAGAPELVPRPLYLAHANALKDDLTVAESLRFLLHLAGSHVDGRDVEAALDRFGMASRKDAFVRTLSQGQRRRVALARLVAQRELQPWLLDEPFDALDAAGVELLAGLVAEHARRGGCVVLTSHLPLPIDDPAPAIVQLREPALA
ncbi:MAG TPA: cytochrome c biogenesis heme-transporting ATPase CcmA [Caldimonas sp.]|jgi:heme exporter protein A|nr:cytochrome c biogenesis heme-transporting ATPase CcmA [Caldimonas sp.]HEV7574653.1 cytochrome c biogenesis heme-transporting ATPase CcmA [Caldimonas sp.]